MYELNDAAQKDVAVKADGDENYELALELLEKESLLEGRSNLRAEITFWSAGGVVSAIALLLLSLDPLTSLGSGLISGVVLSLTGMFFDKRLSAEESTVLNAIRSQDYKSYRRAKSDVWDMEFRGFKSVAAMRKSSQSRAIREENALEEAKAARRLQIENN